MRPKDPAPSDQQHPVALLLLQQAKPPPLLQPGLPPARPLAEFPTSDVFCLSISSIPRENRPQDTTRCVYLPQEPLANFN